MSASFRPYDPDAHFLAIRDFLSETYAAFGRTLNWRIERWNYARYFVAPMRGPKGVRTPTLEESRQAIRAWEGLVGIWEDAGRIEGVVCPEEPWPGQSAFLHRRPGREGLLGPMLDFAEATLFDPETRRLILWIYDDDATLARILESRGYTKLTKHTEWDSEFVIEEPPSPNLPDGYAVRSMADVNDIERRRKVLGLAFHHPDPLDWTTAFAYEELQRAPDYRPELDVSITAPDGEYVSCCIVWYDERNRIGILEPVGSIRLGFGREVVMEAIRRVAGLGATSVWVGSAMRFYRVIGFVPRYSAHYWAKEMP